MSESAPVFAPVRMRRAFEAICDQIRQQVVEGVLSAGDRLPSERELSEQFGVSQSYLSRLLRKTLLELREQARRRGLDDLPLDG